MHVSSRGQVLGQAYPYLLPIYSHEATSQHQEALACLCDWELGGSGWEKTKKPAKAYVIPEPQQDEEEKEKKERKVRMSLTLLCAYTIPCAGRSPIPDPS